MPVNEDVIKQIEKEFGKNIAVGGDKFLQKEEKKQIISLSPALDIALGGGIPEGSWVIFTGPAKCGKSMTALSFAANCQKLNKHIYYLNIEGRLKKMNLEGTHGLDYSPDNFTIIESTEDKILSAQDYLTIAENIINNHTGCVVILDSFSALCHEKELTEGIGTSTRGGRGLLLSQFCGQMGNVVPVKKTIVLGITHVMSNTSGYGFSTVEKGGNAIKYQVDVKVKFKSHEDWDVNGKKIGKKITWDVETNALGAIPNQLAESYMRYGYGIDATSEIINVGVDVGLIKKAGAWCYCSFMENHLDVLGVDAFDEKLVRANGEAKLYDLLVANPKWFELLKKDIDSMMGK